MIGQKKKRKPKEKSQLDDVPPHLRDFISSIALKEMPDDPETLKNARNKRKKAQEGEDDGASMKKMTSGSHSFTDLEIMTLWNSFRIDFPEGKISRPQLMDVVRRVFPKCDADVVINNIFKVFDCSNSGKVVPQELLMAFSMSMKGSVEDKLHWTFKLYDQDGSGEIEPDEMEMIFTKLCKIAEGTEMDQTRKLRREQEAAKVQERIRLEKQQAQELKRQHDLLLNGRQKKITMLSQKCKRINQDPSKKKSSQVKPKAKITKIVKETEKKEEENPEDNEKVAIMSMIADELSDPARDCRKFDPSKRARELFNALDEDGNGSLTEDEFVTGCMSDEAFVQVLTDFSGDFIWGYTAEM